MHFDKALEQTNTPTSFLPYTVRFEVDHETKNSYDVNDAVPEPKSLDTNLGVPGIPVSMSSSRDSSMVLSQNASIPVNSVSATNSILPSLNSNAPLGQVLALEIADTGSDEEFFYSKSRSNLHSADLLLSIPGSVESASDKLASQHLIKPRSKYSGLGIPASVVEPRRNSDTFALPSVRISRSLSLSHNSSASPNISRPTPQRNASPSVIQGILQNKERNESTDSLSPPSLLPKPSFLKSVFGLHDTPNDSTHSLAIAEESAEEDEPAGSDFPSHNSFNEMLNPRAMPATKMTPYGGFSRPAISTMLSLQNVFKQAQWHVQPSKRANATLTKAVRIAEDCGAVKEPRWVGTAAIPRDNLPQSVVDEIADHLEDEYMCDAVFPDDLTFQGHYTSFCKQVLWPTLHYQIPDNAKSKAFEDHSWGHYKALNQLIADKVVETWRRVNDGQDPNNPGNMVWVQDYHLLLVPLMVRQQIPEAKIGLFLHVSFPSSEVFRCFAQRQEILKGMLGANCITFQSDEYVRHFLQTTNRLLLADTTEYGVNYKGNKIMLNTIPAGIDAKVLQQQVGSDGVAEWRKLIHERYRGFHIILSRDPIGKLRGIKPKLLAYEKFLHRNPEYINKTVLIQICMGSASDSDYEDEVMRVVTRINGLAANIAVQPVIMLRREIEFDQYIALESEASVFVASSMREGLNLTCHEFIISTGKNHSPLILSEFTGSASLLDFDGNGAYLVNPWDVKSFADAIKTLLTMLPSEKQLRWQNCYDKVVKNDAKHWVLSCFSSISKAWESNKRHVSHNLIQLDPAGFASFYSQLNSKGTRLFVFNFETSLAAVAQTDNASHLAENKDATTEPARLAALLSALVDDPNNQVYLASFQKRSELDRRYLRFPRFGLIAENGGYIKLVGSKTWISLVNDSLGKLWIPQVAHLIESKVERLPGSFCEVEDISVRFHAGSSFTEDPERSLLAMGDCMQHINELFHRRDGVHATLIANMVVVQQNLLAIKAMRFLVDYYNQQKEHIAAETLVNQYQVEAIPDSSNPTPVTTPSSSSKNVPTLRSLARKGNKQVLPLGLCGLFMIGGMSPMDEPCYELAESMKQLGACEHVLTVAIRGIEPRLRTNASHVVDGKNQILAIISNANLGEPRAL